MEAGGYAKLAVGKGSFEGTGWDSVSAEWWPGRKANGDVLWE